MLRGKELIARSKEDRITLGAAALSFYAMLAVFPAAIFVLSVLPYLPVPHLQQAIMDLLRQSMPSQAAGLFESTVTNVVSNRHGGLLSFGLVFTLWSASGGVYAVMQELNAVHRVDDERPFWKARGTAILLTITSALLVVVALALAVAGGAVQDWLGDTFGLSSALLTLFAVVRWAIIGIALLVAIALVYSYGPDAKEHRFSLFTPGTIVATVGLALATIAFRIYVANFGHYDQTYGSLGAVIVLLMWLFVAGVVLLFGAEVDVVTKTPA